MTIGDVLDALKGVKDDVTVRFDFGGCCPNRVDSWRGDYAEAAIGFTPGTYYGQEWTTVEQFRAELLRAIDGRAFDGWKGGTYRYGRHTPLHVDNRGNCTNTEIVRVEVQEHQVVLHTEYEA